MFHSPSDNCPCPSAPANGSVTDCSGAIVTFSCNEGFVLSAASQQTCQSDGRWSGQAPSCVEFGRLQDALVRVTVNTTNNCIADGLPIKYILIQ